MSRVSLGGLVAGCALVLVWGCSDPEPEPEPPSGPPARSAGHLRLLEDLGRIAEESRRDNPFLGLAQSPEIREQLAALPEGVPDLRHWLFNKLLGEHDLRLGNPERAVEHFQAAYDQIPVFRDEIPQARVLETIYGLGVAHMRLGEARNCITRHNADSCIFPIKGGGVHVDLAGSQNAIVFLEEALREGGIRTYYGIKSRWLLNIAYMTLGRYPDDVPPEYLIPEERFASAEEIPRFFNIAPELGLDTFDLAGGAVADDFDGDGLLDLVVSSSDTEPEGQMHYFRNRGDGGWEDRTEEAGLEGLVGGLNMIQADYDGDGDVDLLVLRGAWWRVHGRHPNSLLRNEGDGTFSDVTYDSGLGGADYPTQTADWADYDNDGDLDLFVGNETSVTQRSPCQLFRNEGDGTFVDVAAEAGVENLRYAKSVSWGDYDDDGFIDLYVSNLGEPNRLYHNLGDGTFTDVAKEAGVTRPIGSFPSWFWDYDNDGALDLFVAGYGGRNVPPDVADVIACYVDITPRAEPDRVYRGDGKGGFVNLGSELGLTQITLPMGANFGDLDNDGYLDYYLGTGYPFYEGLLPNMMYRNRRGSGFADVTVSGGFGHLQKGHGVVFADLDDDGDQDVFEQIGGQYPGDKFGNALFENPGFGHHWLKLSMVGTRSNRFAIGARVRVDLIEDGVARSVYRHVGTGASFGGNPLRQEIGLGRATRVERLEIRWPATGEVWETRDLPADQWIEVVEGESGWRNRPLRHIPFSVD